jgi:hypothetical protein
LTNFIQEDVFVHFNQQDPAILSADTNYVENKAPDDAPFHWLSFDQDGGGPRSYLNAASGRIINHALLLLCHRQNARSANVMPQLAFYLIDDNDHTSVCQDNQFGSGQGVLESGGDAGYRSLARADGNGNPIAGTEITFMQALAEWIDSNDAEMAWIDDDRFDSTVAEQNRCGTIDQFVNWRSFNLEGNASGGEF